MVGQSILVTLAAALSLQASFALADVTKDGILDGSVATTTITAVPDEIATKLADEGKVKKVVNKIMDDLKEGQPEKDIKIMDAAEIDFKQLSNVQRLSKIDDITVLAKAAETIAA